MKRTLYLLSILALSFCSPKKEIAGFDSNKWTMDPNGCKGERLLQLDQLKAVKSELVGFSSESIDEVLGDPDSKDLDKRQKLYYTYTISGAESCKTDSTRNHIYLQIRFNAINRADELIIFQ